MLETMTVLAQINLPLPSDETMQTALNTRSDVLAIITVIVMLVVGAYIARIVARGIDRQNDALAAERTERQKLQGALDTQRLRTTALEDKIEKMQADAAQAQHLATQERERLVARLEIAEKRLREQETAFNDERAKNAETIRRLNDEVAMLRSDLAEERKGSMALYAENETLRAERDSLRQRVDELERRLNELIVKVDKRATDEHPAAGENHARPESKIETEPLKDPVPERQPE